MDIVIQPLHDDTGAVNGIAAFSLDVTELVHHRRRAALLDEEMAAVLDLLTSGVVVVDEQGRVVKINEAGKRIARQLIDPDRSLDEQASTVFDLRDLSGNPIAMADMPISRALRGEAVPTREVTFLAGDPPERVTVRSSVRSLRDPDGTVCGALILFTELEARRA